MDDSRRNFLGKLLAAVPFASVPFGSDTPRLHRALEIFRPDELKDPLADKLAGDPLRPQFHLLPAKNWMNDPNGPIFWKGMYHMFFQYNPSAAVWGDMHWAHAVSPDMVHWKHLPIALTPTPGWDDADGCFTGSAVEDHGTATMIYTGVKTVAPEFATLRDGHSNLREVQCLATSNDPQLRTWTKWKTPVIEPPNDASLAGFRDPFLWRDDEVWYLGVGSGVRKQGGRVLLYRSKDLRQWEYLHPLAFGKWTEHENVNPVDSGEMWECPDFFPLGKKHVLLYSTAGKVVWETGELDPKELVFHPQREGELDYGAYYAQKTQIDAKGNRILWGWIPEKRSDDELRKAGWAGCMSLPRVLSLNQQGDLMMRVAPVVQSLRGKHLAHLTEKPTAAQRAAKLIDVKLENLCGELSWSFASGPFSLALADGAGRWWSMKVTASGAKLTIQINDKMILLSTSGGVLRCQLLVDGSVTEFFCNDQHAMTSRIYRKPDGPLRVEISDTDVASLRALEAWQVRPISANRLTT